MAARGLDVTQRTQAQSFLPADVQPEVDVGRRCVGFVLHVNWQPTWGIACGVAGRRLVTRCRLALQGQQHLGVQDGVAAWGST
jgi:hypothetical protein